MRREPQFRMGRKNEQNTPSDLSFEGLSHVTAPEDGVENGSRGARSDLRSKMVDITEKPRTERSALARVRMRYPPGVLGPIMAAGGPKGPIEEVARAAGFLAAKKTPELIPMCHPLLVEHLEMELEEVEPDLLEVRFLARTMGGTGVEMEAMVGAAISALTVYDMTKALDKGIRIESLELMEKRGGKSGHWRREGD